MVLWLSKMDAGELPENGERGPKREADIAPLTTGEYFRQTIESFLNSRQNPTRRSGEMPEARET